MAGALYKNSEKIQVQVVSLSPHTFAYKLWVGQPSDDDWQPLDQGDIHTPPTTYGSYPRGTKIAYDLLVYGNPKTDWQVQVVIKQSGQLLECSPPAERGTTADTGTAERETVVTLS